MNFLFVKEPVIKSMRKQGEGDYQFILPLRTSMMPVSLLAVAGHIKRGFRDDEFRVLDLANSGFNEFLVEERKYGNGSIRDSYVGASVEDERFKMQLKYANIVLMSCNFGLQLPAVLDTIEKIKRINPKVYSVCGGQYVSKAPGKFNGIFDLVWRGTNLSSLASRIKEGRSRIDRTSEVVSSGLDSQVYFPDLGFINPNEYKVSPEGPLPDSVGVVLPLKMSVGCPRPCPPCGYVGKKMPVHFKPEAVIAFLIENADNLRHPSGNFLGSGERRPVLYITDEITNLDFGGVLEVLNYAESQGYFWDFGNTVNLASVGSGSNESYRFLFRRVNGAGCIGVCSSLTLRAVGNDEKNTRYREQVLGGLDKILSQKPLRISINLAATSDSLTQDNLDAVLPFLKKMRSRLGNVPYTFHIYRVDGDSFSCSGNPELDVCVDEILRELNEGSVIDLSGNYRYTRNN